MHGSFRFLQGKVDTLITPKSMKTAVPIMDGCCGVLMQLLVCIQQGLTRIRYIRQLEQKHRMTDDKTRDLPWTSSIGFVNM